MSTESSTSSEGEATSVLSRKERIAGCRNMDEDNAAARESLSIICRARRPAERQRRSRRRRISNNSVMRKMTLSSVINVCEDEDEEDEEEEVESKINALQKIVPGGESLGLDNLFEETAGYILALQFQVKALKFLTNFVEGSEKEKRKLGG